MRPLCAQHYIQLWGGGLQSDMGSILDDLDDDVVRSGLLALAIMILILLPNFCFRVPKPKFE